jgi:predicted alpha/beta-hydrolase family hydrolase
MDDWKKRLDDLFQKKAAYEQKLAEDRQKAVAAHAQQFSLVAALFDSTINPAFEEVRSELLKHGSEPNIVLGHPSARASSRLASALEIDEGLTRFGYEIYAVVSPTGYSLNTRAQIDNYETARHDLTQSLLPDTISKDDIIKDVVDRYVKAITPHV